MAISLIDDFSYKGKKPNFTRDLFDTVEDMVSFSENYLPSVFECNVVADGKRYRYCASNTDITDPTYEDDGVTIKTPAMHRWREVVNDGGSTVDTYTKTEIDTELGKKVDVKSGYSLVLNESITQIGTNKDAIGDITKFNSIASSYGTWDTIANAIKSLYGGFMKSITFNKSTGAVDIEYIDSTKTKASFPLAEAIASAKLSQLADVSIDTSTLAHGDVVSLVWDTSSSKWVNYKLADDVTSTCKTYTDTQINAKLGTEKAVACDSKPTYTPAEGETKAFITYVKDSETKTTEDTTLWFYYTTTDAETSKQTVYQTKFIDGTDFTLDVQKDFDLSEYVKKGDAYDTVSTMPSTVDDTNKNKIPTVNAIHTVRQGIATSLGNKVNVGDIADNLTSTSSDVPLSANQGRELKTQIDNITNKETGTITTRLEEFKDDELSKKVDKVTTESNKDKYLKVSEIVTKDEETGVETKSYEVGFSDVSAPAVDTIEYKNDDKPSWTNVESALDGLIAKVYYVNPLITAFNVTPSTLTYETGSTIAGGTLVFDWTYNKTMASQSLTDITLADATVRTATYEDNLSSNKTFVLSATDSAGTNVTRNITIAFKNKVYYGVATKPDSYDSTFILGLPSNKFADNYKGTYTTPIMDKDQRFFIAFPVSFGTLTTVNVGGFDTDISLMSTISFTNSSGGTSDYYIYAIDQAYTSFTSTIVIS